MAIWIAVLCTLLTVVLGSLHFLGAFRRRRPKEPPLDKGYIPWLGYALDFRNNSSEFLQKMQRKHGDIFTVLIGGYYFTFVMDPLSFGAIVKESRSKLDFEKFASELVRRVFGYHPVSTDHKIIQLASTKYLMGDGLVVMTQAMMENLQNVLLHSLGAGVEGRPWSQDGLFHYSYNIVFRAGYLALYGNEPTNGTASKKKAQEHDRTHSEEVFHEFRKYDRLFPRLAYAVLPPKDKMEAERLKKLFWNMLSVKKTYTKDNISGWISSQERDLEENGVPEYMRDRFMFLLLWASQGNTGPASFWLLLYLMKHPEAMKAVREEVDQVLKESGQAVKPCSTPVNVTRDMLTKTPVLDSAVEEMLRLAAGPILIRAVVEDMNLKMANGEDYILRGGDRVALFPYVAVQMDPEIHPEPLTFKYNRFLNPDGTKKDFYKNGKKLKYSTMPWGAGTSICPGRFFAVNEIKLFVFLMLLYYDMELVNGEEEIPPIDNSRWGFGMMQPTHDIQFRYRLRF
ncbi:PREDICTED: 5-beta-cholestane-3-alpha,7-alpha-diol 12-alpha-hydroxylase [Crocodylus porosus]|uniref:Cytochrome P450 family 8 subfamily B member 1 n=1 Tax=Crocodylus porosus TaxID=8502 RepID=A0A7M4E2Q4_CROPO|nr:PREDICTED: 5-beta-cholestane-3-alpha,7-alpha-diol 12-alpha-hydroxylase [Crocodylus porosus]